MKDYKLLIANLIKNVINIDVYPAMMRAEICSAEP